MRANPSTQLKKITLALGLTFIVASSAHAAGLGKLTVLSSLGRPLRAEIEITAVTPNDANQLAAKLANAKLFSDAHVELVPDLSLMNFAIEQRDDQYYVLITSKKAINEPYIEFLVELTSASGRIVREYSMLIDQADAHSSPADNPSIAEKGASVDADPSDIMPPVSVAAKPTHKAVEAQASTHYKVKRGDTLSKIASRYKAKGVTLDQMLIALQKSNPAVFIQGNINLIPAGVMLNIPSAKDIADVDRHEASLSVAAQAMDFEAFRQRLAQHIASSQAQENQASKKIDANKIGSKPPELATDSNQPQDKLEISKVHQPNQNTSDEDTVAKQKALEEAKARVAELEKNTAKLHDLLALQQSAKSSTPAVSPRIETQSLKPSEEAPNSAQNWMRYLPVTVAVLVFLIGGIALIRRALKRTAPHEKTEHAPRVEHKDHEGSVAPTLEHDQKPNVTEHSDNNVLASQAFAQKATAINRSMDEIMRSIQVSDAESAREAAPTIKETPLTTEIDIALSPEQIDAKLELARACQQIGDKQRAKELLVEAIRDGNNEQVTRAKAMFNQLG